MSTPQLPRGFGNQGGLGNVGVVFDLSTLRQPAVAIDPEELGYVVSSANLVSELLPASHDAVAIILCWSPRSPAAQSLIPMMRAFNRDDQTPEGDPTWIFGTVNVDAEPAVAKALQVQSVPLAIAIIQEQLVPLFESVPPAEQVRAVINKVLELAAQKGVGAAPLATEPTEAAIEPEEEAAMAALESGDFAAAKIAYQRWIAQSPTNSMAVLGLAQVELLLRIGGLDPIAVKASADGEPTNIKLAMQAADCDLAEGDFDAAAARLITTVKLTAGDERKAVREHLLMLFTLIDYDDPRLAKARTQLASALF
jgi:putative thioredoxin